MNIIDEIKKHFKQFNAYKWALLIAAILGFGVILPLFVLYFLHTASLPPIEYFWMPFAGISLLLSGSGYVGRALGFVKNTVSNLISRNDEKRQKIATWENIGVTFGVMVALILGGVSIGIFHEHTMFPIMGGIALSAVNYFSVYGGVNNRIGRGVFDRALGKEPVDTNYAYGIRGGLLVGLVLVVVILAVFHPVMAVFPLILTSFAVIGMCASIGGYVGRVFDHLLGGDTHLVDILTDEEKRAKTFSLEAFTQRTSGERIGTAAGMITGIVCGALLVSTGLLMLPFFGASTPAIVLGILMIASCANIGAGLGNRLGCLFDKPRETDVVKLDPLSKSENHAEQSKAKDTSAAQSTLQATQQLVLPQQPVPSVKIEQNPQPKKPRSASFSYKSSTIKTTFGSPVSSNQNTIHSKHASLKGFGALNPHGENQFTKFGFNH